MAAALGLRTFGTKVPDWLRHGPWAPLAAGFCSRGLAGAAQPEPGPRPTSARQRDGIRSAAGPRAPWPSGAPCRRAGLVLGGVGRRGHGREMGRGGRQRAPSPTRSPARAVGSQRRPPPWTRSSVTAECGPQGGPGERLADMVPKEAPGLGTGAFGTLQDSHLRISSGTASTAPHSP